MDQSEQDEQGSSWWDDVLAYVLEQTWQLGHILMAFDHDTEDSIVTECIRCEATVAVDGPEHYYGGSALKQACR